MLADDFRRYLGEILGTLILCAIGGFSILTANNGDSQTVVIALGFGFAFIMAFYAIGHMSGAHLNPAVSLAMALQAKLSWMQMVGYWLAQAIGAILGFGAVRLASSSEAAESTVTRVTGLSSLEAVLAEVGLTLVFVLVILTVTKQPTPVTGIIIGVALIGVHLAALPFTGASVNPARSFGAAVVASNFTSLWIYLIGPTIGGFLAWLLATYTNVDQPIAVEPTEPELPPII